MDELTILNTKIYTLAIIAHATAPVSPILFQWIHFQFLGFEFNQYNFGSVVLIVTTIMYQLIAYFFLTDLTRDQGYLIFLKMNNKSDGNAIILQQALEVQKHENDSYGKAHEKPKPRSVTEKTQ